MRAHKFGQKWEIGQKSPALTGLRKTNAAIPIKPFNSSRSQRFQVDLEPITTNARGGVIRESRRTRGFRMAGCLIVQRSEFSFAKLQGGSGVARDPCVLFSAPAGCLMSGLAVAGVGVAVGRCAHLFWFLWWLSAWGAVGWWLWWVPRH